MKAVVDLQGFFLCPFQCIIDFNEQLSQPCDDIRQMVFSPLCELNSTNDWINLEALGSPVPLRARQLVEQLSPVLKKQNIQKVEWHIYLGDAGITLDNVYAIFFLADVLDALDVCCYTHGEPSLALQDAVLLWQEKSNVRLRFQSESDVQRLESLTVTRKRLLQTHDEIWDDEALKQPTVAHLSGLIGYAWMCLKAGAYELGCRIFEKLLQNPLLHPIVREHLFMHLQLVRFLSHQYRVVTDDVFPEQFQYLTPEDTISLYFIKAYSATLSRNLVVADRYFKKSNVSPDMPMTDEASLYRLNLHALFLVLNQRVDEALALELQIKQFIEDEGICVVGLKYVNFINIARVYKKLRCFDEALAYYQKAYHELRDGGFTASDYIYYYMNLGSLYEAFGHSDAALFYWVQAALHWLTFSDPYALAWRPRLILCQEKITDILKPLSCDSVNQFFTDKITALLDASHVSVQQISAEGIHFVEDDASFKKEAGYLAAGIVLYRTDDNPCRVSPEPSLSATALNALVSRVVRYLMCLADESMTFVVSRDHEGIYPSSPDACLSLALISGCCQFYYEGQSIQFNQQQIHSFLERTPMMLSKMIRSVQSTGEGTALSYHRSFLNKTVTAADEMDWISYVLEKNTTTLLRADKTSLLHLIAAKVIVTA